MMGDLNFRDDKTGWFCIANVGQEKLIWIVNSTSQVVSIHPKIIKTGTDSCMSVFDECSNHRRCTLFSRWLKNTMRPNL